MRGRTNYTGGAMPVINGTLEEYEVAEGYVVNKGDFVQFTAQSDLKVVNNMQVYGKVQKMKVSDGIFLLNYNGGSYPNYTRLVYLISFIDGFKILDSIVLQLDNSNDNAATLVEYNGKFYAIQGGDNPCVVEISVIDNKLVMEEKCSASSYPGLCIWRDKLIAITIYDRSSSDTTISYEVFQILSNGDVVEINKGTTSGYRLYEKHFYPCWKAVNGYIYVSGTKYSGSSNSYYGMQMYFYFDYDANTLTYKDGFTGGNDTYNKLLSGFEDCVDDGFLFTVLKGDGTRGVLEVMATDEYMSLVATYYFKKDDPTFLNLLQSGLCKVGDYVVLMYSKYVSSSVSTLTPFVFELLELDKASGYLTKVQELQVTVKDLGIDGYVRLNGFVGYYYENKIYCFCSYYANAQYFFSLITLKLVDGNLLFESAIKIKPYDGSGFALGFSNQNGNAGDVIGVYVP